MELPNVFGERLKKVRIERGLNAIEIAKEIGLSKSAISQIENGLIYPSATNIIKICQLLEVSADYLLGLSETKERR